jgi:hypothetical protein
VGPPKRGRTQISTRQSYVRALKPLDRWTLTATELSQQDQFRERDIGRHIHEQLGIEEGTYEKAAAERGSETTTTTHQQTNKL